MRHHNPQGRLERLLLHPTRLAILLALAAAGGPMTLADLEKLLGVPRQTLHTHLEAMAREGLVVKRITFSGRPRPVYELDWRRVDELLEALHSIRARLDKLIGELEKAETKQR